MDQPTKPQPPTNPEYPGGGYVEFPPGSGLFVKVSSLTLTISH